MPEDELEAADAARVLDLADIVRYLREALAQCGLDFIGGDLPQRKNILTYVGAINDAGLDGEAFVRYGCTHDIAVPLALALALDSWGDGPTPIGQQWVEALGIGSTLATSRHPERTTAIGELATAVFPVVCD